MVMSQEQWSVLPLSSLAKALHSKNVVLGSKQHKDYAFWVNRGWGCGRGRGNVGSLELRNVDSQEPGQVEMQEWSWLPWLACVVPAGHRSPH